MQGRTGCTGHHTRTSRTRIQTSKSSASPQCPGMPPHAPGCPRMPPNAPGQLQKILKAHGIQDLHTQSYPSRTRDPHLVESAMPLVRKARHARPALPKIAKDCQRNQGAKPQAHWVPHIWRATVFNSWLVQGCQLDPATPTPSSRSTESDELGRPQAAGFSWPCAKRRTSGFQVAPRGPKWPQVPQVPLRTQTLPATRGSCHSLKVEHASSWRTRTGAGSWAGSGAPASHGTR